VVVEVEAGQLFSPSRARTVTTMSEKKIELNRRRVLGGMATLGVAAAAAGAGTYAAFSDTEQSNNNQVSAGTLDLTVDGGDSSVTVLNVADAVPGETGSGTAITLANEGNVDGTLDVTLATVSSAENGTNDPESNSTAEGTGVELESALTVTVTLDGTTLVSDTVANLSNGQSIATGQALNGGGSTDFNISYEVDAAAGNEIQSDSVSLDFTFDLTQA
jgi:predicted ribosomally synthesized peptide with SipW-like signal peptide